jgi:membrane protein
MKNLKNFLGLLLLVTKTAFKNWVAKDPFKESAVIAYYAIFALPGLLAVVITVAGYFFGHDAVNGKIAGHITSTMGELTALQIQDIIAKGMASKNSVLATVFGVITILVGATAVFVQFQVSLNTIWVVKADETKSGLMSILKARLFSFGIIIAIAFILITSLVVSATLALIGTWVASYFSTTFLLGLQILNIVFSFSIITLLFALMFKFIPDVKIKWHHVWVGSIVTALLFEIGKAVIGLYFGKANPGSGYGAAGSIILIMLWVSYSSMIVFYGAEFTHAYAERTDGKIDPDKNARAEEQVLVK